MFLRKEDIAIFGDDEQFISSIKRKLSARLRGRTSPLALHKISRPKNLFMMPRSFILKPADNLRFIELMNLFIIAKNSDVIDKQCQIHCRELCASDEDRVICLDSECKTPSRRHRQCQQTSTSSKQRLEPHPELIDHQILTSGIKIKYFLLEMQAMSDKTGSGSCNRYIHPHR